MKSLIVIFCILFVACQKKADEETLSGDLYFGFFRYGSFYNQPDSIVRRISSHYDTLSLENAALEDRRILRQYKTVKTEKLMYHPFVNIKTNLDSIVTLYLDTLDYNKIKINKRKELQDRNKKVRIEAEVKKLDDGLYYCIQLKSVEIIEGQTLPRQSKLKIEDYN